MNESLISRYAEEINHIARKFGVVRLRIFGSQSSGKATDASDVDFLVDFEPGRDLFDLIGLKQDLETLLKRPVDVVEEEGLSPYLRKRILQEARPL